MKIKYDDEPKKTRPCTFADVPVGGVFKVYGQAYVKTDPDKAVMLNDGTAPKIFEDVLNIPVTYYPDATLHMGRAVTEVPCD